MPILSDADRSDLAVQVKSYMRNGKMVRAYDRTGGKGRPFPKKQRAGTATTEMMRTAIAARSEVIRLIGVVGKAKSREEFKTIFDKILAEAVKVGNANDKLHDTIANGTPAEQKEARGALKLLMAGQSVKLLDRVDTALGAKARKWGFKVQRPKKRGQPSTLVDAPGRRGD